jgi:hypothetical protein
MSSKLQRPSAARLPLIACLALGLTAGGIGCASLGLKTTQGAVVGGLVGAGAGAAIGRHGHGGGTDRHRRQRDRRWPDRSLPREPEPELDAIPTPP